MKQVWFCLIGLFFSASLHAQRVDESKQGAIDQIIELVSENLESEELDFTTLLEDLNYLYEHPLNLNRANREQMQKLFLLSDFQIEALLNHIQESGKLLSLLELQGIAGFDLPTIRAIEPFVKVSGQIEDHRLNWQSIKSEGTHEAFIRYQRVVEEMEGYSSIGDSALLASPNSRYTGTPERILTRYRFRYFDNISIGVTGEKDAGEMFFNGNQPQGFDFYSGHVYFGNQGILKHAIVGDYQVEFGQGLTYWTGLAFGKSADIKSIKRNPRGIAPYVSAAENSFMRGAATTIKINDLEVTAFYSNKFVDANRLETDTLVDDTEFQNEFSSFQKSGIHGTPGQLFDKDAIREVNAGGHIRINREQHHVGVSGVYTEYHGDYTGSNRLYRQFEPTSNRFYVAGFDYQFLIRNVLGFGEASLRSDGGVASLFGALISLDQNFTAAILNRNYAAGYSSPRSNAIGEASRNTNESGLYFGMEGKFSRAWKLSGYYDLFSFPWLRYNADTPTKGKEYFAQLEFKPNKVFSSYVRYRMEEKEENYLGDIETTRSIGTIQKQWYRLNWQYTMNKSVTLRNRVEYIQVAQPDGSAESGWMIYQDLIWKPSWPAKYQLKFRYALFDTDGYDSRIYAYEHDVLYSFSIPAYYHRGSRAYIFLKYKLTRWSDLSIRASQTFFANRTSSGSGLNEIDGPTRTEVKAQLRVKF